MTPPKDSKELREATKRSIALLVAQRRGADKWGEEDLVTASNILFVTKKLMDSYAKEFGRRERLENEAMKSVISYYKAKGYKSVKFSDLEYEIGKQLAQLSQSVSREDK